MPIASTYYGRYNVRIAFATDVLGSSVVTGAISEIVTTDLDANRALISDASGKIITSSTVTSTELSYIAGVTSSVQTQLNAKEGTLTKGNLTEATSSVLTITGGTGAIIGSGVTIEIDQADSSNDGYLSSSDWSTFNAKLGITLTDTYIFVGNGSNEATGVAVSGDITMANDGTVAIASGVIVDADINASAAITRTKLAAGTAYRILVNDGSGVISENAAITASRAVVSDSNGQLTASSVTTTELGYSSGVTSAIQTQLDELIVGLNTSATVKTPTASQHLYALIWDNTNNQWDLQATGSGGSLTGPGSSTDNAIVRWDGTGGTAAQNSGILIDDSDNITDVTSITLDLNGLHLLDTDASHDLIVAVGSDLTSDRTLTVITGDSDRTITLSGSPTLGDWFDQSVKAADSVVFSDLTLSNLGGLHILDTDSSHDLIVTTSSNLTADRTLTLVPGDANRTLTINASGTVYVTGGTDVALADGGTGASLVDPNADRILFWDDSAGAVTWLTVGTGLSITATTLEATGGGIGGSTGSADNALLRADGTGGSTVQSSSIIISDTGDLTLGTASLAGDRSISVSSSDTNASLSISAQGSGGVDVVTDGVTWGFTGQSLLSSSSTLIIGGTSQADAYYYGGNSLNLWTSNQNTGDYDSGDILIKTGGAGSGGTGNHNSGSVFIDFGTKQGTGIVGSLALFTSSVADWQDMEKGMFIGDATTAPTDNPASGIFKWVSSEPEGSNEVIRTTGGHIAKPILQKKATITGGATLRGIGTSPVTILPAPGVGKYLNIVSIAISYKYGTAVYNYGGTDNPMFSFSGGGIAAFYSAAQANSGVSFNMKLNDATGVTTVGGTIAPTNSALILTTQAGGNATTGDGDLDVTVYYTIENENT